MLKRISLVAQYYNTSGSHTLAELIVMMNAAKEEANIYSRDNKQSNMMSPDSVFETITSWLNPLQISSVLSERKNLGLNCQLWKVDNNGFSAYELVSEIWMDTGH